MLASEFVKNAIRLKGTPYNTIDCIGVVRYAANIKCQGTNWLWRSIQCTEKYRYLYHRMSEPLKLEKCENGILVFKIAWNERPNGYIDKPNCYHVGIVTSDKTVIHSTQKLGVHEEEYNPSQWQGYGYLKQIDYDTINDEMTNDFKIEQLYQSIKSIEESIKDMHSKINDLYNATIGNDY